MKSHTSLIAQQTRLNEWAELIRDCQSRPQGMKIDEWCQLHDITKFCGLAIWGHLALQAVPSRQE